MAVDLNEMGPAPLPSSTTMPMNTVPAQTYRPARSGHGPGRWFRACAGIEENIMDWAPSERAKYTGLGIIVLNTGFLAGFAMLSALGKIVSASTLALLPLALAWGWIIFSVDRWLITSTHGVRGLSRVLIFTPRLLLAILIAFTIAEPLTLRIFQNTLDTTVTTDRAAQLDNYQSTLQTCNPVSGQLVTSAACAGHHLSLPSSPYAQQQKLANAREQQQQLNTTVNRESAHQQKLTRTAQGECAGTSGAGMSGEVGWGKLCAADWAAVKAYGQQHHLTQKQTELDNLGSSIQRMIRRVGAAQQTYAAQLHAAIAKKVQEKRKDIDTPIGIIDEWNALEQLSGRSAFVFFGHWLLVLVMTALDCLPVLAKLMGGSSTYDQLVAGQKLSDERIYQTDLRFREVTSTVDKDVEIYLAEIRKRDRKRQLDQEERVRNAQGDTDGLDDVRALAARWLQEAEAGDMA